MLSRADWGARFAVDMRGAPYARDEFIVHHTVGKVPASGLRAGLRQIELQHHNAWGWSVGYNVGVDPDGVTFEGCGWGARGQHAEGHNTRAIGCAYFGDGRDHVPGAALAGIRRLFDEACARERRTLTVLSHSDTYATECCGSQLRSWVHAGMPTANRQPTEGATVKSAIVSSPTGAGYYIVGADGGVFTFGDAVFRGSLPGLGVTVDNIVDIAVRPQNDGYWLLGSDGGVFAFGGAEFKGRP